MLLIAILLVKIGYRHRQTGTLDFLLSCSNLLYNECCWILAHLFHSKKDMVNNYSIRVITSHCSHTFYGNIFNVLNKGSLWDNFSLILYMQEAPLNQMQFPEKGNMQLMYINLYSRDHGKAVASTLQSIETLL